MYQQQKKYPQKCKSERQEGLVFTTADIFFGVTDFIKSRRLTLGALLSLFVESKNDRNNLMLIDGQNV